MRGREVDALERIAGKFGIMRDNVVGLFGFQLLLRPDLVVRSSVEVREEDKEDGGMK